MGIFRRSINKAYAARDVTAALPATTGARTGILSPWAPPSSFVALAIEEALGGLTDRPEVITREVALKVPGVKRAHGIACATFAGIPFFQHDGDTRTKDQPRWLYTAGSSGVAPYHRAYGMASDFFFNGWTCLGFNANMTDALHIPFGMWNVDPGTGNVIVTDESIAGEFRAHLVAIPLGYGENGLLVDGLDTLRQARRIEASYNDRLDNPTPLTVLRVPLAIWNGWNEDERQTFRDTFVKNRKGKNGATAVYPNEWSIDMPGQVAVDLYETGRNAVRLDIANHTSTPASMLEGVRQGGSGGGTEMRYQGVGEGGVARSEFWDFGLPKRMVLALEARLSLDDVSPDGLSIRADLSSVLATPTPTTNPTSED